jgi:hypothetical protein
MRNVSDRTGNGNQITHFILYNFFFINLAVYEIMWKNTAAPDTQATDDNIIRRRKDAICLPDS